MCVVNFEKNLLSVIVNAADHCNVVMSAVRRSSFLAVTAAHLTSTLLVVECHVSDQLGLRSSLRGAQSRGRALPSSRSSGLPGMIGLMTHYYGNL